MAEWQFWLLMFGVWFNILFMVNSFKSANWYIKVSKWWSLTPVFFVVYSVIMFINSVFG